AVRSALHALAAGQRVQPRFSAGGRPPTLSQRRLRSERVYTEERSNRGQTEKAAGIVERDRAREAGYEANRAAATQTLLNPSFVIAAARFAFAGRLRRPPVAPVDMAAKTVRLRCSVSLCDPVRSVYSVP